MLYICHVLWFSDHCVGCLTLRQLFSLVNFWVYVLEKSFVKTFFLEKKRVLQKGTSFNDTPELMSNRLARSSTVLLSRPNLLKTKASFTNLAKLSLCETTWVWINGTISSSEGKLHSWLSAENVRYSTTLDSQCSVTSSHQAPKF